MKEYIPLFGLRAISCLFYLFRYNYYLVCTPSTCPFHTIKHHTPMTHTTSLHNTSSIILHNNFAFYFQRYF